MKAKWRRIRPGYCTARVGFNHATIERGAETGRWWWAVYLRGKGWVCGREVRLIDAQHQASEVLR